VIKIRSYEEEMNYYLNNFVSIKDVCKKFHIDNKSFSKYLKLNNIEIRETRRKYIVNEEYFDIIDTEDKAYWLGFLMGDGCIKSNNNQIQLALSNKDEDHVIKFKNCLNSNYPIIYEETKFNSKSSIFRIYSKKMYNRLNELNFTTHKSMNEKFIHSNFDYAFIRGIFDADGWITKSKNHLKEFGICSSLNLCNEIKDYLISKGINKDKISISKNNTKKDNQLYRIRIFNSKDLKTVYDLLYQNKNCINLERKKIKFEDILK